MKTIVSAPVSICLSGASVANGVPRLLTATHFRATASIDETIVSSKKQSQSVLVQNVCEFLKKEQKITLNHVLITLEVPRNNLDSTPALVVTLIGAVIYHVRHLWNPLAIHQIAHKFLTRQYIEDQGATTTSTVGGFVWYRKELPFLQSIWQLPIKLDPKLQHFILFKTNTIPQQKRSTILDEKQTKELAIAFKSGDEKSIATFFKASQGVVIDKAGKWWVGYHPRPLSLPTHPGSKHLITVKIGEEGIRLEKKD